SSTATEQFGHRLDVRRRFPVLRRPSQHFRGGDGDAGAFLLEYDDQGHRALIILHRLSAVSNSKRLAGEPLGWKAGIRTRGSLVVGVHTPHAGGGTNISVGAYRDTNRDGKRRRSDVSQRLRAAAAVDDCG